MKEKNIENNKMDMNIFYFPLTVTFVGFISYLISQKFTLMDFGDIHSHIAFAKQMFEGTNISANPGFHKVWAIFYRIGFNENTSCVYAYVLFSILAAISIYFVINLFLKDKVNEFQKCMILIFMTFVGPIYFSSFNRHYYVGVCSFNTWHSPTNTAVKFAFIIAFFIFIYAFDLDENETTINGFNKKLALNIISGIFTFISVIIKPSFFQVFAPTVAIVYLVDIVRTRRNLLYYIKNGAVYLPSVFYMLYQTLFLFGKNGAKGSIEISFFDVLRHYSPNVLISLLLGVTFPAFIFLICYKEVLKDKGYFITIVFYIVSVLEASFLTEAGGAKYSGNFLWGMCLGIGAIFLYSIFVFINYCIKNSSSEKISVKILTFIGCSLISLHFIWGIWYYCILVITNAQCF